MALNHAAKHLSREPAGLPTMFAHATSPLVAASSYYHASAPYPTPGTTTAWNQTANVHNNWQYYWPQHQVATALRPRINYFFHPDWRTHAPAEPRYLSSRVRFFHSFIFSFHIHSLSFSIPLFQIFIPFGSTFCFVGSVYLSTFLGFFGMAIGNVRKIRLKLDARQTDVWRLCRMTRRRTVWWAFLDYHSSPLKGRCITFFDNMDPSKKLNSLGTIRLVWLLSFFSPIMRWDCGYNTAWLKN